MDQANAKKMEAIEVLGEGTYSDCIFTSGYSSLA